MANKKISDLPAATTPLSGPELVEIVQGGTNKKVAASDLAGAASGTVTSFSAGNLSPLFTTNVATPTTTPALTFGAVNQNANLFYAGPSVAPAAAPTFRALVAADVPLATETAVGGRELANTSEAQTGTDDATIMTPLKNTQKGRLNRIITGAALVAQTDDQGVIFCNSASSANLTFPVLAQYTWGVIWNIGAGDINFITSSTTISGEILSLPGGNIGAVTFFYTATNQIYIAGGQSLVSAFSVNGSLSVKAGNSTGIIAKVGGVIHTNTTTTSNIGTGEDTLFTYTVPAATLNADKDTITATVAGSFATSVNNKRLRTKFGATTIFDSGALAVTTAADWTLEIEIIRTGAATQKCNVRFTSESSVLLASASYSTAAETLSGTVALAITGEATADNDIVGEMFKVRWEPSE